ncbi:MAG: HEPN domain-containing protein [Acidimicrobiales bacterium]
MATRQKEPAEEYVTEAATWLGYARGDLATARSNHADRSVPNRNAGYMAQQAAKKAIKAVILLQNEPFDMIHDIDTLAVKVPDDFVVPTPSEDLSWLTDLETSSRYPDQGEIVTSEDAERAIDIAARIVAAARDHFVARGVSADLFVSS